MFFRIQNSWRNWQTNEAGLHETLIKTADAHFRRVYSLRFDAVPLRIRSQIHWHWMEIISRWESNLNTFKSNYLQQFTSDFDKILSGTWVRRRLETYRMMFHLLCIKGHDLDAGWCDCKLGGWILLKKAPCCPAQSYCTHHCSTILLPYCPTSLFHHLARFFTSSIQLGYIPTVWKIATFRMLLNPDKLPSLTTSYRPFSLISSIMKLFERVIEQGWDPT